MKFMPLLIGIIISKQIVYQFTSYLQKIDYWVTTSTTPQFTNCGDVNILGGYGDMNGAIMRYFELPSHYRIYIEITFYRIDSWNNDKFKYYLDNQLIYSQAFTSTFGTQLCGQAIHDEIIKISIQVQHTSRFAVFYMEAQDIDGDNDETWGISQFTLNIDPCPQGCEYCESNSWLYCKKWYYQYLDLQTDSYQHYDQYLYRLKICNPVCSYQIILPYHNYIKIRFKVSIFKGLNHKFKIYISNQNQEIHLSSNNFKLGQLFDVTLVFSYSVTNQINFQIEMISGYPLRIQALEFLVQKNDEECVELISGCLQIISNICWECFNGWIFDEISGKCILIEDSKDHETSKIQSKESSIQNHIQSFQLDLNQCKYEQQIVQFMNNFQIILQKDNQVDQNIQEISKICMGYYQHQTSKQIQYLNPFKSFEESFLINYNQCQVGWTFDLIQSICIPICGNKVVQGYEQCDNDQKCRDCLFECPAYCQKCVFEICQECISGYFLNTDKCEPICGDGELIPYQEQCDDQNTDQGDGCFNCKFECSYNQFEIMCITCPIGYIEFEMNCIPVCGDKIILPDFEDCDDGNDEKYDGCYQCKYQCHQNCVLCVKGVCQDKCNIGEIIINNTCESVCGNQIVTGQEECDDGNTIQFDGCHQCEYSCPLFCNNCDQGICSECQDDYQIKENQCLYFDKCGNGLIGHQEECDDGNQEANDGCSKCIQDENWICNKEHFSECSDQINPRMILTYLNRTMSIQYIKLQFSQEIIITDSDFSMETQIKDLKPDSYNITVFPIIEASSILQAAEYDISVDIFQLLSEKPTLNININSDVINNIGIELLNKKSQIQLQTTSYLTSSQKQNSQSLSNQNENIIYGLGALGFLSFFMGDAVMFQEILKLLQFQSYLKYINVDYPSNLLIFFQSTNIVSVSAIVKYTNLNYYLIKYSLKQGPLKTGGKFALYKYDADLILNLSCQILQLIGLVSLMIVTKLFLKLIYRKQFIIKVIHCMNSQAKKYPNSIVLKINKALYSGVRGAVTASQSFAKQGLTTLYIVNSQDLIFKALLFLNYFELNLIRDYVQLSLSLLIIVAYLLLIFMKQPKGQINEINIIHSFVFLGLIVFCQGNQIQQILLISLCNVYYLIGLLRKRKTLIYPNFVQIGVEGIVILFTLTSLLYVNDLKFYISDKIKISLGWGHIGILMLSLLAEASKFIVAKGKILFEQIKKMMEKKKRQEAPRKLFYEITM